MDFPGSPVTGTPWFHCTAGEKNKIPGWGINIKKKKKKKRKRANFCTENLNSMLKYMVDTGLPLRRPTFRTESSFLQLLKELVAKSLQLGLLHPSQRSLVSQAKIKNHSILGDKLVGSIQDNSEGQPAPELPVRLAEVSVVTASCPTFPQ